MVLPQNKSSRNQPSNQTNLAKNVGLQLYIFIIPVQKEGILPGFHIHPVCKLPLGHSSQLKVI